MTDTSTSNDDAWDEAKEAVAPWTHKSNVSEFDYPVSAATVLPVPVLGLDFHQFPPGFRNT